VWTSQPTAARTCRTSSGGTIAPPQITERSDDKITGLVGLRLQKGDQHGGHAQQAGGALGLDDPQHNGGIEGRHQDHPRPELRRAQGGERTARRVEHRHGVDHAIAGSQAHPGVGGPGVIGDPPVVQHDPLGKARRAGGVLI
jgi:hypothetical protein